MAEKNETKKMTVPAVTVAVPVVYLVNGNINQPQAAICLTVPTDDGQVDLGVYPQYGGATRLQRSVRHLDDPLHEQKPDILGRVGAYLSPREFEDRRQREILLAQEQDRQRHLHQMKAQNDRICSLARDGMPVGMISAQVGVSDAMVEEVLRNAGVKIGSGKVPVASGT